VNTEKEALELLDRLAFFLNILKILFV